MQRRVGYLLSIFLVAIVLSPGDSFGQTTNASVVGTVTDPSGAAVVGASITVTNTATGVSREARTLELGTYRVYPLAPGTYTVTASMQGFKTQTQSDMVLEVASSVKVDFALEVGAISDTVVVTAIAPMLQTQETSVGGLITGSELERLPVNGRNYTSLILLMPGTSDRGKSQSTGTFSGTNLYSVNGQRTQDNNYTMDGVENNFFRMNSPGASPPMDAIQEFRVMTDTSAEFGRSAGANVNMAIKSGTRDLHGSLYEYLRNDKLDANDFFANREARGKVPFRQNQYGFAVGGPVVLPKLYNGREKTFWFVNWEGYRRRRGTTAISTVPVEAQRLGDFSQQTRAIFDPLSSVSGTGGVLVRQPFANNRIPENRISAASRVWMDTMIPLPNRPGLTNNLVNTQPYRNDRDIWVVRGDHILDQKNNLSFRYLHQNVGEINPAANPYISTRSRFDISNLAATWNHISSPTSVLEVKFGYNGPHLPGITTTDRITRADFLSKTGIRMFQPDTPFATVPILTVTGEFSASSSGVATTDRIYQAIATYTKLLAAHSLKFGVNYSRRQYLYDGSTPMHGTMTFDRRLTELSTNANSGHSTASFLLGYPSSIERGEGDAKTQGRQNADNFFFQDDWRVSRKLTVNLGLRYEYNQVPYDITDRVGTLLLGRDPTTGRYTGTLLWGTTNPRVDPSTGRANEPAKTLGYGRALQRPDKNNFAPRAGIAWQIDRHTVIRSSFGIFYNSTFFQELQDKRKFYPYNTSQFFAANSGVLPDLYITDPGPAYENTVAIGGWAQGPDNRSPYSQQWNFTVQRQFTPELALDLGYVGSSNRKQIGYNTFNTAVQPGPGPIQPRRLLPDFGDLNGGWNIYGSNYHSLQAKAVKRFSKGLQFQFNYTWSRSMDDQSSLAEGKTQNPFNRRADYSRSSWDLRHVAQFAYVYDLPFGRGRKFGDNWARGVDLFLGGWSVEGITRLQTGGPVNVVLGQDRANVGTTIQRPDAVRDPNHGPKTPDAWFDTGAFQMPAVYTYGNAGAFIVDSDGRHFWDVSLQKRFAVRERQYVEFRTEFYNFPNSVSMADPNANFSSSAFGKVTSATAARQIQLALRYSF